MSNDRPQVRQAITEATQALLGDCIQLAEDGWRAPSKLPGWSRGHVATHIARNAEAMTRVVRGMISGVPTFMYDSAEARASAIDQGAGRSGLDQQVDLDTTAGELDAAFDEVTDWDQPVQLRPNVTLPNADAMLVHRLCEVVLHHVDLDCGFTIDDIEPATAWMLLASIGLWLAERAEGFPPIRLVTTDAGELDLGGVQPVTGTVNQLLGWITGRGDGSSLDGTTGLTIPAY